MQNAKCERRGRLGLSLRALAWTCLLWSLAAAPAAASEGEPRRWLIGYHKALFWMSEVELRFFYDIADAYSPGDAPGEPGGGRELMLVAASPAPFAGREWRVDFLLRRGRLAGIGLERREAAPAAGSCAGLMREWLSELERLHGRPSEAGPAAARLDFRRGAAWEVATAYDEGACTTRMQLRRAPPTTRG